MTAAVKARHSLDRGIGFICFGIGFGCPVVGTTAARGLRLILGLVGVRYGGNHVVLTGG